MLATENRPHTLRIMNISCNAADSLEAKREKLLDLNDQAQAIGDLADREGRDLTPAEQAELSGLVDQFDELAKELALRKKVEANNDLLSTPRGRRTEPSPVGNRSAFSAPLGRQFGRREQPESPRILGYKQADGAPLYSFSNKQRLADHIRSGDLEPGVRSQDVSVGRWLRGTLLGDWQGAELERDMHVRNQMAGGDDLTGGFLLPGSVSVAVLDRARALSRCVEAGMQTIPLDAPTGFVAKVTTDPSVSWRPEHTALTSSEPNFGRIEISPKTVGILITNSIELSEDASNITDVIETIMSEALASAIDLKVLYGSGAASEPAGLASGVWGGLQSIPSIGAITDWSELSLAVGKLYSANAMPTADMPFSAIMSPREAGTYDLLVSAGDGQPLQKTPWVENLRMLPTTQVSITEGGGGNESSIFVGDWTQAALFVRTRLTLQASQEAGDAFAKLQILLRAFMRVDVAFLRDDHFVRCSGITTG